MPFKIVFHSVQAQLEAETVLWRSIHISMSQILLLSLLAVSVMKGLCVRVLRCKLFRYVPHTPLTHTQVTHLFDQVLTDENSCISV